MNTWEVMTESITPCGGEKYAIRTFSDVETDSPRAWVQANGRFPILEENISADGDPVIVTGNAAGYRDRYIFTK